MPMQRNEAVAYLREILNSDNLIAMDCVSFENEIGSSGYRVRIKIHNVEQRVIKEIAEKRNLAVVEEKDTIIVYEP